MRVLIRQFFSIALAMFIGVWAALWTYEKWVVAPRKEREAAAVAAKLDALNGELARMREAAKRDLVEAQALRTSAVPKDELGAALASGAPIVPDVTPTHGEKR